MSNLKKYLKVVNENVNNKRTFDRYMEVIHANQDFFTRHEIDEFFKKEFENDITLYDEGVREIIKTAAKVAIEKIAPLVVAGSLLIPSQIKADPNNTNGKNPNPTNTKMSVEQSKNIVKAPKKLQINNLSFFRESGIIKTTSNDVKYTFESSIVLDFDLELKMSTLHVLKISHAINNSQTSITKNNYADRERDIKILQSDIEEDIKGIDNVNTINKSDFLKNILYAYCGVKLNSDVTKYDLKDLKDALIGFSKVIVELPPTAKSKTDNINDDANKELNNELNNEK